jgi:hypothetical protein
MAPIQGEFRGPISIPVRRKSVIRFDLARKRNDVGFIPEPRPQEEIESPCPPLRIEPYAAASATRGKQQRKVARRSTGGTGGEQVAARGGGLAPRGHCVEARILADELLPYRVHQLRQRFLSGERLRPSLRPLLLSPLLPPALTGTAACGCWPPAGAQIAQVQAESSSWVARCDPRFVSWVARLFLGKSVKLLFLG